MASAGHEQTVRRFMAALESAGNLDVLSNICVPSVATEWRTNMENFSFTDRTFTVDDMVAEGSKVAILWTISGNTLPSSRLTPYREANIEYRFGFLYIR